MNFEYFGAEILLNYGIQGGIRLSRWNLLAELTGLAIVTDAYIDVSERFMHNLIIGTEYNLKFCTPGIFYNFYLNRKVNNIGVLGIKLDYSFRSR